VGLKLDWIMCVSICKVKPPSGAEVGLDNVCFNMQSQTRGWG